MRRLNQEKKAALSNTGGGGIFIYWIGDKTMATPAQINANRENAKRPRQLSEEAKESLRTRALQHGFAAKLDSNTVIPGEDEGAFKDLLHQMQSEATLGTAQELALIQVQAQSFWKMQRANNMETGTFITSQTELQMKHQLDPPSNTESLGMHLSMALVCHSDRFDKLRRYATAAERVFFKATRELAQLRKAGPQPQIGLD